MALHPDITFVLFEKKKKKNAASRGLQKVVALPDRAVKILLWENVVFIRWSLYLFIEPIIFLSNL